MQTFTKESQEANRSGITYFLNQISSKLNELGVSIDLFNGVSYLTSTSRTLIGFSYIGLYLLTYIIKLFASKLKNPMFTIL